MLDLSFQKSFSDFALDVNFQTDAPFTALFGPSGAGKSSVLAAISGLLSPDSGSIILDGQALFDSAHHINVPSAARALGVVFQEPRLFPHMNVEQNLTYAQWAGGRRADASVSISFDQVVEILGLTMLLKRRPANLSGGEQQRVAIGRALLSDPRMLLLDEPFASLDIARRVELRGFLRMINQEFNVPMFLISHDLDDVIELAEHLVLMNNGVIADSGPTERVFSREVMQGLVGIGNDGVLLSGAVISIDASYDLISIRLAGDLAGVSPIKLLDQQKLSGVTVGTQRRLRILAKDVALALTPPQDTSLQNCLPIRIDEIESLRNGHVRVYCDCFGEQIMARITKKSADELGLATGQPMFALLKSIALI